MKTILTTGLFFMTISFFAQAQEEHRAVRSVLENLFYSIESADSSLFLSTFHPDGLLYTADTDAADGMSPVASAHDFALAISRMTPGGQSEKIWKYDLRIDDNIAQAWLPYSFYVDGEFHHCGTNSVSLTKGSAGWKITHIIDTRHSDCHQEQLKNQLDEWLDAWHHAAATADEDTFFGKMSPDGIYLGTDASEKWKTHEMEAWAEEYFQRDTAWAFTPMEREFYLSDDQTLAWFDETLQTWMGLCRGSGVLEKSPSGKWSLRHYNLAVLVPNDKIQEYIKLLDKN